MLIPPNMAIKHTKTIQNSHSKVGTTLNTGPDSWCWNPREQRKNVHDLLEQSVAQISHNVEAQQWICGNAPGEQPEQPKLLSPKGTSKRNDYSYLVGGLEHVVFSIYWE